MHLLVLAALTISLQASILNAACSNGLGGHADTGAGAHGEQAPTPRLGRDNDDHSWLDERMRQENQTNSFLVANTTTTTSTATPTGNINGTSNSSINSISAGSMSAGRNMRTGIGGHTHDLGGFRLEYNKYKILSHLGITENLDEMSPALDEEARQKILTTTTFKDTSHSSTGSRHKRSLTCDQVKSDKSACCLENFYVNFTHIGWDKWILYPAGYNANYCRGQCDLSLTRYYHSTLLSKYSNVISLCCSPKQMAPLRLLYIDEENKVHQKSIPDMIVESCDCA